MDTIAQQPKLAVAGTTMMPMQQQPQIPKPQQPITATAKPVTKTTIAAPAATIITENQKETAVSTTKQPKRVLRAPMQILINLKKKRQEIAAMRAAAAQEDDDDSSEEDDDDQIEQTVTAARIAVPITAKTSTVTNTTSDETATSTKTAPKKVMMMAGTE